MVRAGRGGLLLKEHAAARTVVAREARVVAFGACANDDEHSREGAGEATLRSTRL